MKGPLRESLPGLRLRGALRTKPHGPPRGRRGWREPRPLLPPQGHALSGSTPKSREPAGREPPEATAVSWGFRRKKSPCQVRPRLEQDPCSRGGAGGKAGCPGAPADGTSPKSGPHRGQTQACRGTTGLSVGADARPSLRGGRLPFGALRWVPSWGPPACTVFQGGPGLGSGSGPMQSPVSSLGGRLLLPAPGATSTLRSTLLSSLGNDHSRAGLG